MQVSCWSVTSGLQPGLYPVVACITSSKERKVFATPYLGLTCALNRNNQRCWLQKTFVGAKNHCQARSQAIELAMRPVGAAPTPTSFHLLTPWLPLSTNATLLWNSHWLIARHSQSLQHRSRSTSVVPPCREVATEHAVPGKTTACVKTIGCVQKAQASQRTQTSTRSTQQHQT